MNIAILGVGVVGSALQAYLSDQGHSINCYDPGRELNDNLMHCDCAFIAVPVPTQENRSQDLSAVFHCLEKLQKLSYFSKPIFIKSTILPGTTKHLQEKFLLPKLYHMPEFLTERFAFEDMMKHDILCGGRQTMPYNDMIIIKNHLFPDKIIHFVSNEEAELSKYAHNCMAAVKINFFNLIYQYCKENDLDYENVRKGTLLSGLINEQHTHVPGPDGYLGYGGKCFPKDLSAFIGHLATTTIAGQSLSDVEFENKLVRNKPRNQT